MTQFPSAQNRPPDPASSFAQSIEKAVAPGTEFSESADDGLTAGAVLGATIGNMLEFYDFVTYSFFATQIGHAFFPAKSQFASLMLSLATSCWASRPHTTASASQLRVILARLTQGFSLGGEVGPTTAYLMEAASTDHRGFAVSFQPASQQIAATAGALVGEILSLTMTSEALDSYGWRIAFLLGACTLPFGLWLRRTLPETLHRSEASAITDENSEPTASAKTLRINSRLMVLGLVILASGTISTYVTQYLTTYAQHTLHVAAPLAFATTVVSNGVGIAAALLGGWLADRAGRWPIMVWPQIAALLLTYPIFLWVVESRNSMALLGGLGVLALVGSIPYSAFFVGLAEGLPKRIRGGAFATIYAVAIATFGGTAQLVVAWLTEATGNALAPAWYLLFATAVGLGAMILMPETAPCRTRIVANTPAH